MSLKIRLARGGAHKRPHYRVVVTDTRSPRDSKFVEKVGYFDPLLNDGHPEKLVIKQDRVTYWLGVGAKPSDRVTRLLAQLGMLAKPTPRPQTKKNQPKAKAQERQKAAAEAAAKEAVSNAESEGMVNHTAEVKEELKAAETPEVIEVVEEVTAESTEEKPSEESSPEEKSDEESSS